MNKKIPFIVFLVGVLFVIIGVSLMIFDSTNKINKDKKELENKILEEYEVFKQKIDSFNLARDNYYNKVAKNLYPELVEDDYEEWLDVLNNYTITTDDIENVSNYLKENCVNKYYSNNDIKNKCDSFVIAYETAINYYTKDIYAFNDNLDLYRSNNDGGKESILDYNLKYSYVDIDSDGRFFGKD